MRQKRPDKLLDKRLARSVKKQLFQDSTGLRMAVQSRTFSRGGSDVTGSLVAKAIMADMYENWTDVSGFLVTDPRIVDNPAVIETITYRELRELILYGSNGTS